MNGALGAGFWILEEREGDRKQKQVKLNEGS